MKKNILLAACFGISLFASAQNDTLTHEREITLAEAIALARTQSVDAAVALNELKTAYRNRPSSDRCCTTYYNWAMFP
jgi:hypothetical protein